MIDHWERYQFGCFMLTEIASHKIIGYAGLQYLSDDSDVELIATLPPANWGKGFAREAVRHLVDAGFAKLRLSRIIAGFDQNNQASRAIVLGLGMSEDASITYYGNDVTHYVLYHPKS